MKFILNSLHLTLFFPSEETLTPRSIDIVYIGNFALRTCLGLYRTALSTYSLENDVIKTIMPFALEIFGDVTGS